MFTFYCYCIFFFKQKTAYEMRISDWSSDVCSSDLFVLPQRRAIFSMRAPSRPRSPNSRPAAATMAAIVFCGDRLAGTFSLLITLAPLECRSPSPACRRSEEHTSELQSLMRISYAVFCLKTKTKQTHNTNKHNHPHLD